ncbi:glucose-1-phosphate adenylyltransferase family protein [Planosporangium sp. 12N6]|uniref:glucose-1-phosphate adenylyltransferase family protein n=1 Tax=Planosporangium spinosum TaxID=3402278 RepID=UPI003CEA7C1E
MTRPRTLMIVLAGGAGGRLELLTEHRAKPAVPFGGSYRLIDVPLSNARHSGIEDVWVIEQFHASSIADHLANGRPWDLDRTQGGLLILHPEPAGEAGGWHRGTADALGRQAPLIRQFAPEHLVVVSADAVYRLDYDEVVRAHAASGADVTMVTTRRPIGEAGRYGVVRTDGGRITEYVYKPDEPATDLVATEVFVFDPVRTLDLLDRIAAKAGDDGPGDLGDALLPALVREATAREYRLERYWRDVGTVPAYLSAHLELVAAEPPIRLDDPAWPMLTADTRHGAARVERGAEVVDALLAPGARVAGRVERCVLSPGAVVEPGARVADSVLLPGALVERGARVTGAVVDSGARIGAEARVDGSARDAEVVLVGAGAVVASGSAVAAGARVRADEPSGA